MPSIAGEGCRAGDCEVGASGGARTGLGVCAGAREMVHEGAMRRAGVGGGGLVLVSAISAVD